MRSFAYQQQQQKAAVKLVLYSCGGLLLGVLLGYIFMGAVHTVLQVHADQDALATVLPDHSLPGQQRPSTTQLADVRMPKPVEPHSPPLSQQHSTAGRSGVSGLPALSGARSGLKARPLLGGGGQGAGTAGTAGGDTAIHTLITSNGSPYLNFQNRIMYATYKMAQQQPGGEGLVAFTRILHRTQPDILMVRGEMPTFRAEPLTPACDTWCEFPVSDRPNAVAQFLAAAAKDPSLIKAPWLFMTESDYVWAKPVRAPRASDPAAPSLAFPFNYIVPDYPGIEKVMRLMYPLAKDPLSGIPGTGPAPVLMREADWRKVTPTWERLTAHIEADPESKEQLGWVREMYAFSVAMALEGIPLSLPAPPASPLLSQPPSDHTLGEAAIWHYTWGTLIRHQNNSKVWDFDKRAYTEESIQRKSPRIPLPPPYQSNWKLLEGPNVTRPLYDNLVTLINRMNTAVATLPVLEPIEEA